MPHNHSMEHGIFKGNQNAVIEAINKIHEEVGQIEQITTV